MVTEEMLSKSVKLMENQANELDNKMFNIRADLAKRAFSMTATDIAAMAARIDELDKRIKAINAKIELAGLIAG